MPVLQRRDPDQGRVIGLAIGLSVGSLVILALVYLLCSQMLAPSRTKRRRHCKNPPSGTGDVRVHCENGHAHLHVHKKRKRRSKKSKRKRKKVIESHGANGSGIPGIDGPEIINLDGARANTHVPAVVVPQVSAADAEPFIIVDEPITDGIVHIVRDKRKHRSKKRKANNRGGCYVLTSGSRGKKRTKRGPRIVDLRDVSFATVRRGGQRRVVVAQEPIYQEVIQAV